MTVKTGPSDFTPADMKTPPPKRGPHKLNLGLRASLSFPTAPSPVQDTYHPTGSCTDPRGPGPQGPLANSCPPQEGLDVQQAEPTPHSQLYASETKEEESRRRGRGYSWLVAAGGLFLKHKDPAAAGLSHSEQEPGAAGAPSPGCENGT